MRRFEGELRGAEERAMQSNMKLAAVAAGGKQERRAAAEVWMHPLLITPTLTLTLTLPLAGGLGGTDSYFGGSSEARVAQM